MAAALRLRTLALASTPRPSAALLRAPHYRLPAGTQPVVRQYSVSVAKCMPTAMSRATKAADLRAHPECGVVQEKLPDVKHMHHWEEANATQSEADVHADRESILGIFQPLEPKRAPLEKK